jgi:beta-lactamase superfamily II metal-dependent hydrolase
VKHLFKPIPLLLLILFLITPNTVNAKAISESNPTFNNMHIKFLNVGQGDGIIIKLPNGKSILVDAGPREASEVVLNGLVQMNIKKLDLVISTHPDIDHIGGLIDILRVVPVKKIYDSGKGYDTLTYLEYIRLVHERKIPFSIVREDKYIKLDKKVKIKVLNSGEGKAFNNNASIVLMVTYKDVDILLAGDAEKIVEMKLISKYNIKSEVLKVAHHGSSSSTSGLFLNRVSPLYAIISVDKNSPFKHPHKSVVKRLKNNNIKIFSTAKYGDINLRTDGTNLVIENETLPIHD